MKIKILQDIEGFYDYAGKRHDYKSGAVIDNAVPPFTRLPDIFPGKAELVNERLQTADTSKGERNETMGTKAEGSGNGGNILAVSSGVDTGSGNAGGDYSAKGNLIGKRNK